MALTIRTSNFILTQRSGDRWRFIVFMKGKFRHRTSLFRDKVPVFGGQMIFLIFVCDILFFREEEKVDYEE